MSRRSSFIVLSIVLACRGDDAEGEATSAPSSTVGDPTTSVTHDSDADTTADDDDSATDESSAGDPTTDPSTDPSADDSSDDTSATDPTDATTDSGDPPQGGGVIDVTLSGCNVDLGGTLVVSYNGSLGVASVYDNGATLTGSFQFDELSVGVFEISSQGRVDTGLVINLTDVSSTWTNLDSDALVSGMDTISGTLTVETWMPEEGVSLLHLDAVTLRNVVDGGLCTVNGTIETMQLYP